MWVDTRDREPSSDGIYLVQMAGRYMSAMNYTTEGGWNTHKDSDGNLSDENAMTYKDVARWFDAPEPEPVPDEWYDEWRECLEQESEVKNAV